MTTQTLVINLEKEVKNLKEKVGFLESAFFLPLTENEKVRPEFYHELRAAVREKSRYIYNGKTDPLSKFLKKAKKHE